MNALTNIARFPGWSCADDRRAMSGDLPSSQQSANASMREVLDFFDAEVSAVEVEPSHPTLTWQDYYRTDRVERAMQAAKAAFCRVMGRDA